MRCRPGLRLLKSSRSSQSSTRHRALVLWMQSPLKVPRDNPDDPYTCPEYTRGSHYSGPTRVSLVDPQTKKIINTIKILNFEDDDTFDIPYRIESGLYYHVAGVPKGKEGKPTIMWLKDYNGDGHAWEFALFDAVACMGLPTTLIGYSEAQDRVIQYPVALTVISGRPEVHPDCLMGGLSVQQTPGEARLVEICHRLPGESRNPRYLRDPLPAGRREICYGHD